MKYNKQLLLADLTATDGVIHGNSYYYNLFDCKTQKEKDVVRNGANRLRKVRESLSKYSGRRELFLQYVHNTQVRLDKSYTDSNYPVYIWQSELEARIKYETDMEIEKAETHLMKVKLFLGAVLIISLVAYFVITHYV